MSSLRPYNNCLFLLLLYFYFPPFTFLFSSIHFSPPPYYANFFSLVFPLPSSFPYSYSLFTPILISLLSFFSFLSISYFSLSASYCLFSQFFLSHSLFFPPKLYFTYNDGIHSWVRLSVQEMEWWKRDLELFLFFFFVYF